jgi:putative ABC transport system permease protein
VQTLLQDLRYSLRQLVKMPGFTLTAVISLALGIGATTAVFSVVYAILLDPFPYREPDRMIHLALVTQKGFRGWYANLTPSQWRQIRRSPVVEDSFLSDRRDITVTGRDLPENILGASMSSNAFEFLGVAPALGRNLQPSDAIDGQDPQPIAELGYKFWQRHFSANPAVVGKTITLDHRSYLIVGVAAPRFTWQDGDVYLPLKVDSDQTLSYFAEIRLKPGVTHAQADAALQPLIDQFAKETPKHFPPNAFRLHVMGINENFVQQLGGTLYLLFGAVSMLLLIGCGNVSILLLARATARRHEFAMRAAIGASRGRIVRQLLTESLSLSISGAVAGLVLASVCLKTIVANLPADSFPHEASIHISLAVLLFSIAAAMGTGVLFGLWPALQLSRPELSQVMQSSARKTTRGVSGRRAHGALIAGQIALTLVLLTGASAAIEGFLRLAHVPLGYDPHNVMSVGIPLRDGAYTTWAGRAAYFDQLRDKVAQVPGVTMAALSTNATPPSNGFETKFEILGKPSRHDQTARLNMVSPQYFPLLRIPLLQGRIWDQAENNRGALVAVVNQTLARTYFPAGDAVGHAIKWPGLPVQPPYSMLAPGADGWLRIVGVVEDKLDDGLSRPVQPEVFVSDTLIVVMGTEILVRTQIPPLHLLHAVQLAVNSVDRDQQTGTDVRDLNGWIEEQPEWARGHLISWLFGAFAALALALAAVGLFSVVSYTVVQRTNEFGIRIALGAPRSHVLSLVFNSTVASVGAGILAGIVLTLALNRVLAGWDAESSRNPILLLVATGVLALLAAVACALPAARAAASDPMQSIRYE